tara:strand:+ start:80 stop:466 length:387 start_codon:yes stop_codon:yes gene_type:complete
MRKQKIITVAFKDGEQQLPSSVKVKCNVTGTEKGFYTPYLIKLIKRKYENNYKYFIENYISKGMNKDTEKDANEPPDLSLYMATLQLEYAFFRRQPKTPQIKSKISAVKEKFDARFPDNDIYNEHYIQ